MTMPNGIWVWVLDRLPPDYLSQMQGCGVTRVYLKILDGKSNPVLWAQCNKATIDAFKSRGIEVWGWGYHYGASNPAKEVAAVQAAVKAGISGYVLDIEVEGENPANHPALIKLASDVAKLVPGNLAYTSFGHPKLHPRFPWQQLDKICDFAMPQIYFELFTFGSSDDDEVNQCIQAHAVLGLTKPIYPIWSSEPGAKRPASVATLQKFLDAFEGSSIWRAAGVNEVGGHAFDLNYALGRPRQGGPGGPGASGPSGAVALSAVPQGASPLPQLTRVLKTSMGGDDVQPLQDRLHFLGFLDDKGSGVFDAATVDAVKKLQMQAGLAVDGLVGPETWNALGASHAISYPIPTTRLKMADIAMTETSKDLVWTGPTSEAEKYLKPLRAPMQALGHIGGAPVFYNWCAAFVTWCARGAGATIPDTPAGYWATMALVESWKFWAKQNGTWLEISQTTLERGDIVVYEWSNGTASLDHIGIVASFAAGNLRTYEGNVANKTFSGARNISTVAGVIRLPGVIPVS